MKKVLSLVLAVMMVVGMTTVAFAATGKPAEKVQITFSTGSSDLVFGVPNAGDAKTLDTATVGNLLITGEDAFGGYTTGLVANTDYKITTSAAWAAGKVTATIQFAKEGKYQVTFDAAMETAYLDKANADPAKRTEYVASTPVNPVEIVTITKDGSGTTPTEPTNPTAPAKKVPSGWKVTGFDTSYGKEWVPTSDSKPLTEADQKSFLPLEAGMFLWKNPKGDKVAWADITEFGKDAKLTSSQLSDIGVRRSFQKGTGNTIRDAEVRTADSAVRVRTVKFYPLTKETDVELKLTLTYKGSSKEAPEYTYVFTIENQEELIEEDQFEVYSYGNIFLKADATVRNVEFQGDEDEIVYATKTVVKGQKYYFNVTDELEKVDEQMIADNPEIDSIYNVYQSNMANATVQFKNLDREFFVYDAEGKLLGTTKDSKLPLARKYILTTAKVDFGGADEEPVEEPTVEEPADVDAPPMGGGEVPPSNNYNPNTGL